MSFSLKINKIPLYGTERVKSGIRIKHRLDLFLVALSYQTFVKHPMASSDFADGYPTHDVDGRPLLKLLCRGKFFNQMNVQPSLLRKRLPVAKAGRRIFHLSLSACYDLTTVVRTSQKLLICEADEYSLTKSTNENSK